jgi:hypothetical protein
MFATKDYATMPMNDNQWRQQRHANGKISHVSHRILVIGRDHEHPSQNGATRIAPRTDHARNRPGIGSIDVRDNSIACTHAHLDHNAKEYHDQETGNERLHLRKPNIEQALDEHANELCPESTPQGKLICD